MEIILSYKQESAIPGPRDWRATVKGDAMGICGLGWDRESAIVDLQECVKRIADSRRKYGQS